MVRREPHTYLDGRDESVLTDVTAEVKSQTNRARSEVSGVVSGAGRVCQCFKHLRLMRVLQVGRTARFTQLRQGSRSGVCVLTGGAGHKCTHERSDGIISHLNEVVGG